MEIIIDNPNVNKCTCSIVIFILLKTLKKTIKMSTLNTSHTEEKFKSLKPNIQLESIK